MQLENFMNLGFWKRQNFQRGLFTVVLKGVDDQRAQIHGREVWCSEFSIWIEQEFEDFAGQILSDVVFIQNWLVFQIAFFNEQVN